MECDVWIIRRRVCKVVTHVSNNLDELEVVVRHASAQCGVMEREQKMHVTLEQP